MKKLFAASLMVSNLIALTAFANAEAAAVLKYSADKIIQKEKTHTVELIGNAQIILQDAVVSGNKITLHTKTDADKTAKITSFTGHNLTVNLKSGTEKL